MKYFLILLLFFPIQAEAMEINLDNCKDCLDLNLSDINEIWGNTIGGKKRKSSYLGQTTVSLDINFDKIFHKNYGKISVSGINVRGNPESNKNYETLDFISSIENYNQTKLYEFYYENNFKNLYFKVGKFDLSSEFGFDNFTSKFLNASGITSMVVNNNSYNMTNYGPTSSLGISMKYKINDNIFKIGLSSDNPYNGKYKKDFTNINTDKYGTDVNFKSPMLYFEYEKVYKHGKYYIGGFYDFGKEPITYDKNFHRRNFAIYFTFNQELYKDLNLFFRVVYDPKNNVINIKYTVDTGIVYSNFGLMFSIANENKHITTKYKNHNEYRLEFFYNKKINNFLYIQPDIQYIVHPSANYRNEMLIGCRTVLNF